MTWRHRGADALLGPSCCGKTTLLNIISGLVTPSRRRLACSATVLKLRQLRYRSRRDLREVDVAIRANGDPVCAIRRRAAAVDALAVRRESRDRRDLIGDKDNSIGTLADIHGPAQAAPFRQPSAVRRKDLHAVVLAIGDKQPTLAVDYD